MTGRGASLPYPSMNSVSGKFHALPSLGDKDAPNLSSAAALDALDQALYGFGHVPNYEAVGRVDEAVLIGVGEVGEDSERVQGCFIPSVLGLHPLHDCPMVGVEQGDASICHPLELRLALGRNRELGLVTVAEGAAVEHGHLANQVVERRSEVVKHLSEHDSEAKRRWLSDLQPLDPFPRLRIEFTELEAGFGSLLKKASISALSRSNCFFARLNFSTTLASRCSDDPSDKE